MIGIGNILIPKKFYSGVLKITPAHNHLDYTIAKNHGLNPISVIDEKGTMTEAAKCYKVLAIKFEQMLLNYFQ